MNNRPKLVLFGNSKVVPVRKDDSANTISGQPDQRVWLYAENQDSGSRMGIWDCKAGTFGVVMEGIIEFCNIIEGEAEITNLADGGKFTVKAGDSFVMEPGLRTEWYVPIYVKKNFVISEACGAY